MSDSLSGSVWSCCMELVSGTISTRITNMISRINQLTAGCWDASILTDIRHNQALGPELQQQGNDDLCCLPCLRKENSWQVENRTSHRGKICSHAIFVSGLVSFLAALCGVLQGSFAFPPLRQDGGAVIVYKMGAVHLPTFLAKRRVWSLRPSQVNTALEAWTKWQRRPTLN